MGGLRISKNQLFFVIEFLVLLQRNVFCYQYKVGDLDSWGIPTSAKPNVYTNWPKNHNFKIGDSLLFLYPPTQDSVIQVSEQSFKTCNIKNPILYMDNGNSLFNITSEGRFYFTSGVDGHCQKSQKLAISVLFANGSALPPSFSPQGSLPDTSPTYSTVFGSIPSTSSSSPLKAFLTSISAVIGVLIFAVIR